MAAADAVELIATGDGVRLRLRVKPGARRDRLVKAHGGALKLEVRAAPERGKANAAVVALLAETLGIPRASITITSGHASQDKTVLIAGVTASALTQAINVAVPGQRT